MTTPPLKLLQLDLTEECPLFCSHCSNSSGPARRAHFPIKKLLELIPEARNLGLEKIVFSGGEPLRYPHLSEALSAARTAGIQPTIFTTGIRDNKTRLPMPTEDWSGLAGSGLVSAAFSVYASPKRRNYHNAIVRLKPRQGDAFGVNEQAIRNARSAGLFVDVHFIPGGTTVVDLPEIYSWAAEIGCSVLHLQIPTLQGRNKERSPLQLDADDEARLRQIVSDIFEAGGKTQFYVSRFWLSRWRSPGNSNCVANLEQLVIRTDGTISPCNACKYGSVTLDSENVLAEGTTLANIWRTSPILEELRGAHGRPQLPDRCDGLLATAPRLGILQRAAY